jgi:hypothetical protein
MITWIEPLKGAIVLLMLAVMAAAIGMALQLRRHTGPLEEQLQTLHRTSMASEHLIPRLREVERRYISLIKHVDNVDTAEFSAGEIETLVILGSPWRVTAAAAQDWIRQAPGILISLGLLGTFAGLTVGLSQISAVLQTQDISSLVSRLGEIVQPMGVAFQTSLLGLTLSLSVLLFSQLTGTRSCLERTEALLSSWLETVLPQKLGEKMSTPLRSSLDQLTSVLLALPDQVQVSVHAGMQAAFRAKLDDLFDTVTTLTQQAQEAVGQLTAMAGCLNESGQDFVEAALAFRNSDFATCLRESVIHMHQVQEDLTASSDALATRLKDLRDDLAGTQSEWKLLAVAAQQELQSSRLAGQQLVREASGLREACALMQQAADATQAATKQLRETRLEVMRDRKLSLQLADSVQKRLAADESMVESCGIFTRSMESALSHWNRNVERLDGLTSAYIKTLMKTKSDDDALLAQRHRATREAIDALHMQLERDIGSAIQAQQDAIGQIHEPAQAAQALSQELLLRLEQMRGRIERISALPLPPPTTRDGAGEPG